MYIKYILVASKVWTTYFRHTLKECRRHLPYNFHTQRKCWECLWMCGRLCWKSCVHRAFCPEIFPTAAAKMHRLNPPNWSTAAYFVLQFRPFGYFSLQWLDKRCRPWLSRLTRRWCTECHALLLCKSAMFLAGQFRIPNRTQPGRRFPRHHCRHP